MHSAHIFLIMMYLSVNSAVELCRYEKVANHSILKMIHFDQVAPVSIVGHTCPLCMISALPILLFVTP